MSHHFGKKKEGEPIMSNLVLGNCVKTMDREVLSQDDNCVKVCGNMEGEVCTKGCMANYFPVPGMTLVKGTFDCDPLVDAVVINHGNTLTTILYVDQKNEEERMKEREKESAKLLSYGLSKTENIIFLKVLEGKKNSLIIKELFISKATLKTHLNNIYKKLPEYYQQYKKRR